ncbi:unnamed protein product, partial [Effrenium voratum]
GQWQTPWGKAGPKGKGLGAPGAGTFAVKMDATYHVEVLRPYPAEDSSVFVHKGGARKDSDMITLEGMSARGNFEGANRPGRWLSMLAASVARGAQIATYARDHFDATGLGEIAAAAGPEIQRACEILDATKNCEPAAAEVETSVQTLLSYCADEGLTAHFQRSAVLAANIYNFSMNALEAAAVLAHRGQWTTELAKNLGALPAPVRDFLQNPANDEALLRALTAAYNHQVLDSQRPVAAAGGDPLGNYGNYAAPPFAEPAPPAAAAAAPAEDPLGASQAPAAGPTLFGRKRPAPAEASAEPAPKRSLFGAKPAPKPAAKAPAAAPNKPAEQPSVGAWPTPAFLRWLQSTSDLTATVETPETLRQAIEAVPNSLRKQYDLAEASESCAASLRALREEYIGTLLEEAEMFCAPKHKVALEEDFIGHGVLTLCYARKAFAEESKAEEVAELIQQLKGDHVPVEAENQLDEAAAIFGLLSAVPADLLEWAGVSPARKYRSIRAKTWPRDVGRAGTLAYLAFAAHLKILQDDHGEEASAVAPEHGDEGEAQARGEKRGRPQPEPAEPVLKPAAARKYCQGFDNIQCAFGPGGERAQPHGPAQCLFCSPQRLEEALGDPARAVAARKRFAQLAPQMQAVALGRVREPGYRNWLAAVAAQPQAEVEEAVAGKYKYCQGYNGIQCSFGAEGRPAQPHGPARCLFCNPEHLQEALNAPLRAAAARRRFAQLSPEAQEAVLGRVVRPEHRDQLAAAQPLLEAEEPAPRAYRRQDQSWRGAAPYTPEDLAARYSAGAAAWEEVLRQRQAVAEPEVAAVEYRVKVVDDRRKSLNMMQQAEPRLPRGAEVSNEDIVAKAAATRLAANLQLWAEFNSWQVCDSCGALQHCIFCRSARPAPRPQPPPDALRGLSLDVRQALQPAEPDFGPVARSRDQFERLQAARAYADFYWEHESFLANNAGCDARARRRWLRFMEKEGLECALWPDLFLERQHCLTWARLQSSSRQARGSERSTLEERLNFDPLNETSLPKNATGLKRSYMALVLSPILDFSLSYELLHFAFDLGL